MNCFTALKLGFLYCSLAEDPDEVISLLLTLCFLSNKMGILQYHLQGCEEKNELKCV